MTALGLGWSEATTLPRDPVTIVGELHSLPSQAGIKPPYVLAGHSYGAILVRVFAHQYPQDVNGLALVDSGLVRPAHFNSEAEFNDWKSSNDVLQAAIWGMTRFGLMRLAGPGDFSGWGYPAEIVPQLVALHSTNQAFDTYYAETIPVRPALQEAAAPPKIWETYPFPFCGQASNRSIQLLIWRFLPRKNRRWLLIRPIAYRVIWQEPIMVRY